MVTNACPRICLWYAPGEDLIGFVTSRIHYKLSFKFIQSIVPTHGVTISMITAGLSRLVQLFLLEQLGEHDGIICNKMKLIISTIFNNHQFNCVMKVINIYYTCSLKAAILFCRS